VVIDQGTPLPLGEEFPQVDWLWSVNAGSLTHTAFFSPLFSTPHSVAIASTICSPPPVLSEARSVPILNVPAPSSTSIRNVSASTRTDTRKGVCACRTTLVASSDMASRADSVGRPWCSRTSRTKSRAARTETGSSGNSLEVPWSFVANHCRVREGLYPSARIRKPQAGRTPGVRSSEISASAWEAEQGPGSAQKSRSNLRAQIVSTQRIHRPQCEVPHPPSCSSVG
jgi:hypothetical protein